MGAWKRIKTSFSVQVCRISTQEYILCKGIFLYIASIKRLKHWLSLVDRWGGKLHEAVFSFAYIIDCAPYGAFETLYFNSLFIVLAFSRFFSIHNIAIYSHEWL